MSNQDGHHLVGGSNLRQKENTNKNKCMKIIVTQREKNHPESSLSHSEPDTVPLVLVRITVKKIEQRSSCVDGYARHD